MLDMNNYIVKPGVPVLDESTIYFPDEDGKQLPYKVTPEFLGRLCANMNRRETKTGDLAPLVLGKHTDRTEQALPKDQPPVVGFARNWRVVDWVDGKKAAVADFLYNKGDYEECKRFPRRSAEVWLSRAEIDPISLLGATAPERDLGLVLLQRQPDIKVSYLSRMEDDVMPETMNAAAENETGISKKLDELISMFTQFMSAQSQPAAGATPDPGSPAPEADGMSDEELEALLKGHEDMGGGEGEPDAPRKDEPVSSNSSAMAGGNSTYNPEVVKLSRQVDELQTTILKGEFKSRISALKNEGYDLDVDAEVAHVMTMPPALRMDHLDRISKNYRKAPISNGMHPALQNSATGQPATRDADSVAKAVHLARSKKITYEDAARELGIKL